MALPLSFMQRSVPLFKKPILGVYRFKSSNKDCFTPAPKCSKKNENCPKVKFDDCFKTKRVHYKCLNPMSSPKEIAKLTKHENPFHALLQSTLCCQPCGDLYRADDLLYRISDKSKRQYQQTWLPCPPPVKQKRICLPEECELPPIERRIRCDAPPTACSIAKPDNCRKKLGECPRLVMPCCKPGRIPPSCIHIRQPSDCIKICAPYPAYSECQRPPTKKRRPVECNCLTNASRCEVIEYEKKMRKK